MEKQMQRDKQLEKEIVNIEEVVYLTTSNIISTYIYICL